METNSKKPNWLIEIENNSWNPELLISGLSIVFIFAISDEINDYGISLVQQYGIHPILVFGLILYLNLAIVTLKITFISHLFLRGVWIGLVGLNYTFPKGINRDKLTKIQSQDFLLKEIKDPVDRILSLERICSSIFSLAFSIVGISIFIMFIIFFTSLLNLLGLSIEYSGLILLVIMLFMSLPPVIIYYSKKFFSINDLPLLRKVYIGFTRFVKFFLSSESLAIMITNTNRILLFLVLMVYSMLLGAQGGKASERYIIFSKSLIPDSEFITSLREKINNKPRNEYFKQDEYLSRLQPGQLIQKSAIDNYNVESNNMELFVAEFKWDYKLLDSLQKANKTKAKSELINQMLIISIDSNSIQGLKWRKTNHKQTNQTGWITFIDLKNTNSGIHNISVDKVIWNYSTKKIELFEGWNRFEFFKE